MEDKRLIEILYLGGGVLVYDHRNRNNGGN